MSTFSVNVKITELAREVKRRTGGRITQITVDEKAFVGIWTDLRKKGLPNADADPATCDMILNVGAGPIRIVCAAFTKHRGLSRV